MAFIAWSNFVELVKQHTPVESDRENVAVGQDVGKKSLFELYCRAGYANLMRYVPYYQIENVTVYQPSDVVNEGVASKIALPQTSKLRYFKLQFASNNSTSQAVPVPWDARQSLIDGANRGTGRVRIKPSKPLVSISPHNDYAYIYPALVDGTELVCVWDGVRKSFKDDTQIRVIGDPDDGDIGEEEAEAISYFVLWKLQRQVDEVGIGDRMKADWKLKRRELKVETRRLYNELKRG